MMFRPGITVWVWACVVSVSAAAPSLAPYDQQVQKQTAMLRDGAPAARAKAVEALGFLRAYATEALLIEHLHDDSAEVRRETALALAWCGSRRAVPALLESLDDADWLTRQAVHVALTNLTGMEFPFQALAPAELRAEQAQAWRTWRASLPAERPPADVLALLDGPKQPLTKKKPTTAQATTGQQVITSSTYKGPPDCLRDGLIGPDFWQTKQVPFPQWCTVDLGKPRDISYVIVHQYGPNFVLTEYELATSLDNQTFEPAAQGKEVTPVRLELRFAKRQARYVRLTSLASKTPTYPATLFEIEIQGDPPPRQGLPADSSAEKASEVEKQLAWRRERGLRALGSLGGAGASQAILEVLGPEPPMATITRPMVRAGIRALGRQRDPLAFEALVALLDNTMWARNAADALGDLGDPRAVPHLLAAYPRFAKNLKGENPAEVPTDDRTGFPSEDRMLETAYWIVYALARLPLEAPGDRAALRQLGPQLMANLPGDFDTFLLYEPEAGHLLTRYLIEQAGLRQEAAEQAFALLGQPRRVPAPPDSLSWPVFPPRRIASWLPCVCTEAEDLPRLVELLTHKEGWVNLNAAKALAWLGDKRAIEPIAQLLTELPPEAEFGFSGAFKHEEFNDPSPRRREGLVRALGLLGAHDQTELLVRILNDEQSVMDIRHAAAEALADLGNSAAITALRTAGVGHSFLSIRHVARDKLRSLGTDVPATAEELSDDSAAAPAPVTPPDHASAGTLQALVFLQGDNDLPTTTTGTVPPEQADRWRSTYAVTDEGPEYRPGENLFVLRPPRPDGRVTPLTRFEDGYVASPEVSWDGGQVLFSRRGQSDPWWHVWQINVDGSGLKQLTVGPYHDIQPAYLPDGRIVFASSRNGSRDEYHGYPTTALWVMNVEGGGLHPIATNIGRDNEPAVLGDGRIVFSRLEVFYSRNKTELTLHAMHPDGTQDVVLYGPERRAFWRNLDHGPPDPADAQEAPLTHRVLRMTQPQPMPDGRHIVVSTQAGLTLIGSNRQTEELLVPDYKTRAYTTPWPLPDGRILCGSTLRNPDRTQVDLGLYLFDPATKQLELVYNDPAKADYEPRPIMSRRRPPMQPVAMTPGGYSGRFLCSSVFNTQEAEVRERGRLVRLIEGVPVITRHMSHNSPHGPVWQNHGGTLARVLGTVPLASDGSFYLEVPADRLLHLQVLDSDRRVVGNQLTWIYPRPGETKSCVGCHENPHATTAAHDPLASHFPPTNMLPRNDDFRYRAKAWMKGSLPAQVDEQTRTVHAVNLLGR